MGVDIQTYRSRIGGFVSGRCKSTMQSSVVADTERSFTVDVRTKFTVDIKDVLIFLIGATAIYRMLLLMAGVESNPGPTGEYTFRYQFLLVEIGSKVLRKVFDVRVAPDFKTYLSNNQKANNDLNTLSNPKLKILTPDQIQLLPPINKNPKSDDFDITLLACLLRNVCGLRGHNDPVWKNPLVTDLSLEADITRLRQCRNNLQHFGTVFISDTDLKQKWNDLSQILNRLNSVSQIPNLQQEIVNAETLAIDPVLSKRYTEVITVWHEMDTLYDRGIEELKLIIVGGHFNLSEGQSEIRQSLLDGQSQLKDDILESQSRAKRDTLDNQSQIKQTLLVGQSQLKDDLLESQSCAKRYILDNQNQIKQDILDGQSQIKQTLMDGQSNIKKDILDSHSQAKQDVLHGISELVKKINEMSTTQPASKQQVQEIHQALIQPKEADTKSDEILQNLIDKYSGLFSELPVSPLLSYTIDMLKLFKLPTFFLIENGKSGSSEKESEIESCKEIFFKEGKPCRKIYLVGDAGVGKSSFSHFLCSIWHKIKLGISVLKDEFSEYVDFMKDIDFVFYVSLRETTRVDIIAMIIDQYFRTDSTARWEKLYDHIDTILKQMLCLVILDGLDEWTPEIKGKEVIDIPSRAFYKKCIFLTTSRPYRTQNLKLQQDSHQFVKITGITGQSSTNYVKDIVSYLNEKFHESKDPAMFETEAVEYGLKDLLCIPIIVSNLIIMWFQQKLTSMSRTLIYSNIVDMQFEIAENKKVDLPSSTVFEVQLPDFLSGLVYFNKHVPLLQKVCLISFRSLFNQDKCEATLVFTKRQLMSRPYCIDHNEMNMLCKIGIFSKTRMDRKVGIEEQKLTFLHLSYLEYFSAMFVALFDKDHTFNDDVIGKWTSLNDVLRCKNFFLFLTGFSFSRISQLFNMLYPLLLSDITLIRRDVIFKDMYFTYPKKINKIKSLQSVVLNCLKESRKSVNEINFIELEDFYFDDKSEIDILNPLLLFNSSCVKFLWSENGKYHDAFNKITNLTHLHVGKVVSGDFTKFFRCMLRNCSSLHTLSVNDDDTLIQLPPLRNIHPISTTNPQTTYLNHITSLSLTRIKLAHESLCYLGKYLCDNVNMQNIRLENVYCDECRHGDSQCTMKLYIKNHKQLYSLYLRNVNIICNKVNTSSLMSLVLLPCSDRIASSYVNVLYCINNSKLEHLSIYGSHVLDNNTVRALTSTLPTLQYIKVLTLGYMRLPDDVPIQLHHDVRKAEIWLICVKMSQKWFESFCDSLVNYKSVIEVSFTLCNITSGVGDSDTEMSESESVDMMYRYVNIPESKLKITHKHDLGELIFETTGCQQQ